MKKENYLLIALAAALMLFIALRFDYRWFSHINVTKEIKADADLFEAEGRVLRKRLSTLADGESFENYKMIDPATIASSIIAEEVEEPVQMTSLKVTGIMKTSDGTVIAVVNGSLVSKGRRVRGCEVLDVMEKGVLFDVAGEKVVVPLHGEHILKKVLAERLTLENVLSEGGKNTAVINGQFYKAGDWIDGDTIVKAVTPKIVLLDRVGSRIYLKVGESL